MTPLVAIVLCFAAAVLSAVITRLAMAYARRRGMLDDPGYRRSHETPTPRGGGIGLVLAALPSSVVALRLFPHGYPISLLVTLVVAGLLVASAGWLDDHHDLGIVPRLVLQALASVVFLLAVGVHAATSWWCLPAGVLLVMWSINYHNFMDGIDAILGLQVAFIGIAWGCIALYFQQTALAVAAFGTASATAGFLWFNWPPARVFMGDVGSSFAGFMIIALMILLCLHAWKALWPALIISSGFAVDAGMTLVWRMWRGKRWYAPHREHLYQWLNRSGWTHLRTALVYLAWNALIAAPLAACACLRPDLAPWLTVMLYCIAAVTWWYGRHACWMQVRTRTGKHAA